ncbi:hypothetical protein [Aureibacter tunicatorum]|uniref:Uncharacterized protein n=1 Tax=Aureibacter tunicatorum TaxID=866807 RepID=A0AAE3XL58_9BACT|nr:hypothetical protein [Aureibacter tunicatorum]MDR6238623.1 hypothetical protein [Aureibacter tunicatorum]BDD05446.1 hypothetical protein AUTU_29290 [Aureibacter tunicatorum]
MKNLFFAITVIFISGMFNGLRAQNASASELEMYKSILNMEKKAVIKENMKLKEGESEVFWKIYEEYEAERNQVANEKIKILNGQLEEFVKVTEEGKTPEYDMNKLFELQKKTLKMKKKFYNKMRKEISPEIAARFYQLDEYLGTIIKMSILDNTPLIGEGKKVSY